MGRSTPSLGHRAPGAEVVDLQLDFSTHQRLWQELLVHGNDSPGIRGVCTLTGRPYLLPRLAGLERLCQEWAPSLPESPGRQGKMFGLLWAGDRSQGYLLKAYSGLTPLDIGQEFVPPIPLQQRPPGEEVALATLDRLKADLALHEQHNPRPLLERERERCKREIRALQEELAAAKQERDRRRQLPQADLAELARESETQAYRMRDLKRSQREGLQALEQRLQQWEAQRLQMRQQRRDISRQLQAELHRHFEQSLFAHAPGWTERLYPGGLRTGTGECCAPKLLYAAAQRGLRPLALAEFWRGPELPGRRPGEFYPACAERCMPLLGPLFFLLDQQKAPEVVYQDTHLLVVHKPTRLLSVPGRQSDYQDSALLRLRRQEPGLYPVHRLDFETSGLLLLARSPAVQAALQRLFELRQVKKTYLAQLQSPLPECLEQVQEINAPIAPDRQRKGCYRVAPEGRPALTRWSCQPGSRDRLWLWPETGRSHQLRVHLAQVLGHPILGDPKYAEGQPPTRLHLQAIGLELPHPATGRTLRLQIAPEF